jgi:hypothetical protein
MGPRRAVSRGNAAGAEIESDGIFAGLSSKRHRAHRMLRGASKVRALTNLELALGRRSVSRPAMSPRRLPPSRARVLPYADISRREPKRRNGASRGCLRASTAIR